MNDLYRMEDKQVETLFSFDEEVLKKALKNIYSKDFHPLTEIEENLFEATWKTINEAADKGFGTRKPDDPDYDFYREIRMNNAVRSFQGTQGTERHGSAAAGQKRKFKAV